MSRLCDPPTESTPQERTMTSPTQRRHDELRDLLTEIRDRLPEPQAPADTSTRERTPEGDLDEALAALIEPLLPCMPDQASSLLSLKIARAARKHIAEEGPLAGELDAAVWHRQFEKEKARAVQAGAEIERLTRERDVAEARCERLSVLAEKGERYEALRADVEREYAESPDYPTARILDADDQRGEQA